MFETVQQHDRKGLEAERLATPGEALERALERHRASSARCPRDAPPAAPGSALRVRRGLFPGAVATDVQGEGFAAAIAPRRLRRRSWRSPVVPPPVIDVSGVASHHHRGSRTHPGA